MKSVTWNGLIGTYKNATFEITVLNPVRETCAIRFNEGNGRKKFKYGQGSVEAAKHFVERFVKEHRG
jgi:hypothetical protein